MPATLPAIQRCYPLINLLLFKLSWVLLVWGQASGVWPAVLLLLGSFALHPARQIAFRCICAVALCGIVVDQMLSSAGLFVFSSAHLPWWLLVLWLHFSLVLPQGFRFLFALPLWLQNAAGAIGGPLSYWAGMQLGAVNFGVPTMSTVLMLAAVWAVLLPALVKLVRWCESGVKGRIPGAAMLLLLCSTTLHQPEARAGQDSLLPLGHATYRFLFMDIYEASLAVSNKDFSFPQTVPFELTLTYKRNFRKKSIMAETLKQWRLQGIAPQAGWITKLEALIPDVQAGDALVLLVDANYTSHVSLNDTPLGSVSDPAFSKAFAGIWLAAETTHPEFRKQLLRGRP